ncbi:MAG: isocitrate/isopropylmalate dehydrogenase family protein [Verrucomicrobia bacterium]|nr:isocitrate/isopropylmalate dehydrogenase family protein [Verrucomicrobiota bacterium]MDA1066981.1 isocitrate/isopropylmalate dehydrogenase family protein [Verrucomicrobiota bacterium]
MKSYHIAVVPGDGIGPEVCQATIQVIRDALPAGCQMVFKDHPAGANHFLKTGIALPDTTIEACRNAHAILLGAAGLPNVLYNDGTEAGQDTTLKLRFELDLYANIRPIKLYDGINGPLKGDPKIDYVIVRENTEGLYASRGKGIVEAGVRASDTMEITRKGVERIVRKAAEICMIRNGAPVDGKHRVTICDKSNVLRSFAFFRAVADEVLADYPEIEVDYALVDALTMYLVTRPSYYDVIVSENLLGDIISDLGAATIGGLGIADSSEIGDHHALFQASHGSAPDIAGKNLANPIATILSGASMLEWLSLQNNDPALTSAALNIRKAIAEILHEGSTITSDLGGTAGTDEFVNAVCEKLN